MADRALPSSPLSDGLEEWSKAQPDEAWTHHVHSHQPTTTTYGIKGANDLLTPIRYDFESQYRVGDTEHISTPSSRGAPQTSKARKEITPADDGVSPKAKRILGIEEASLTPQNPIFPKNDRPFLRLPGPDGASVRENGTTSLKRKCWISGHKRTFVALCLVFQIGVVTLTISIVLCAQDSSHTGRLRKGSIVTGVVGLTDIICILFAGYGLLVARQHRAGELDIEKEVKKWDMEATLGQKRRKEKVPKNYNQKSMTQRRKKDLLCCKDNTPNWQHAQIHLPHLPHNTIYSSRLSNPFSPGIRLSSYNSSPSPRAPGEVYSQIRQSQRSLTPCSPLPLPPSIAYAYPPRSSSLQSNEHGDGGGGWVRIRHFEGYGGPETWAQRLEERVRQGGGKLPDVVEEEESFKFSIIVSDDDDHKHESFASSTESRIISLYSALEPHDQLYHDVLRSFPISPVMPTASPGPVGTERSLLRYSDTLSLFDPYGRESTQPWRGWQTYALKPSRECWMESDERREKRLTRERVWSQAFDAMARGYENRAMRLLG